MKKIDLHLHTSYSDGEDSFRDIFEKIRRNNLSLFSICDHNYISYETIKTKNLANSNNITFLQGVEISCVDRVTGESLHVLGYSQDFDIRRLNEFLQPIVDEYNKRANKIIEKLNNKYVGLKLDFNEIRQRKTEVYTSRNTIAAELIKFLGKEQITMKEAIKESFVEENDLWMIDSKEAIQIINDAGGFAVIAHPGKIIKDVYAFESLLKRLIEFGIVGLEVFYPKHDKQMTNYLNHLSNLHNLAVTAGSDWHGENYTPSRTIGFTIEDKAYEKIFEVFKIRTLPRVQEWQKIPDQSVLSLGHIGKPI
ncbi:MAG: PHP domain-containing protein [Candidatus Jorgensenbacteria bacterium]